MSVKERINNDLKAALLGGDHFKCDVLRAVKAVILNEEVALGKREEGLEDSIVEQLVAKEIKKRNESAEIYNQAGRKELADKELSEVEILSHYLPPQLSEEEILKIIESLVSKLEIKDQSGMGQLIGLVKKQLGNSADGSVIAKLVKRVIEKESK